MPPGGAGWSHPENKYCAGRFRLGVVGGFAGRAGAQCTDRSLNGRMRAFMRANYECVRESKPALC